MARSRSYYDDLRIALQDPLEAEAYLNAALEDGNLEVFLLALKNVVEAQKGISQLAEETGRSRPSLYKTLSAQGNPEFLGIRSILNSLGYHFKVETNTDSSQSHPH